MILILNILLLIGGALTQYAPSKPELFVKIERMFQEREPAWKLEKITPGQTTDPLLETIVYRSKQGQAAISISIWRREQDARESFAGIAIANDNIRGKNAVKRTLPKLGDENYMWTLRRSSKWPTIRLRKGRTEVQVFAPNVVIAERFARNVVAQVEE
jgi:hypothetical protein